MTEELSLSELVTNFIVRLDEASGVVEWGVLESRPYSNEVEETLKHLKEATENLLAHVACPF